MIDLALYQLACRTRLITLSVCTTGSVTLAATLAGGAGGRSAFTRTTGSFLTDGLAVGMELVSSGFTASANNVTTTITGVTATVVTVAATLTAEGAAAARTLAVGLPAQRSWENVRFSAEMGRPWVEEQFLPGTSSQISLGPFGQLEVQPMYVVNVYVPEGADIRADAAYGKALIELFPPRLAITLTGGDVLRVRSDTGPYRGQRRNNVPGWSMSSVTFPLRLRTANSV